MDDMNSTIRLITGLTRKVAFVLIFAFLSAVGHAFADNPADIYKNRGNLYYQKKQYVQAVNEFTKAIEISHDFIEAYYNRGVAYYDMNLYYKAIVDFDMVIMLNPEIKEAYYSRGLAYLKVNKIKLANADISKAAEMGDADAKKMITSGDLAVRIAKEKKRQANISSMLEEKNSAYNRVVAVLSINNEFGGNTVCTTYSKGDPYFDGKDGIFKSIDYFNANDVLVKNVILHTGEYTSGNGWNKTIKWFNPDSTMTKKEIHYTGKKLTYRSIQYFDADGNIVKSVLLDRFGKEVDEKKRFIFN
jgi:tetratricopeptide (TPR) repeat protein